MRKKVFGRTLSRNRRSRSILFRSLIKSVVRDGKIRTTKAKALAIQRELDALMSLVNENSVNARRQALALLGNDSKLTDFLFSKYLNFANSRKSGFTRISMIETRRGDNAPIVSLEWVEIPDFNEKPAKTKKEEK